MKLLKVAVIAFLFSLVNSTARSADYDIEMLTTKFGKIYHEIEVIDADRYGLLFRHRDGIAKESFSFLSISLRELFEPVEKIPSLLIPQAKVTPALPQLPVDKSGVSPVSQLANLSEVTLTVRVRQPVCTIQPIQHGHGVVPFQNCILHPTPATWPSQWHKFHSAHYLTNPNCRAVVTRNFLRDSGLLPRPYGVVRAHRSPRTTSLRFW